VTVVAIRRSSVATMTRETTGDASARRYTCSIIGRPSMSASGLPGNRVEANRAGMTATISSGRAESTREPVDAGCTTNNNTDENCACYDPTRVLMNVKRTVVIGVVGCAVAVWLAAAATSTTRKAAPVVPPKADVVDRSGAELAAEIARLHERLRPGDTPLQSRDLFRYSARSAGRRSEPTPPPPPPAVQEIPHATASPLRLVGIAEDSGDTGAMRTAIISGFGDLFLVKEGEAVTLRYRVARISSDAVELIDLDDNTPLRLALR
jgi:hypothetical protein